MNIAIFVTIWATSISTNSLNNYFLGAPLAYLKEQKAVQVVEIYTPEPGDVPTMDDVPAPAIIIQIDVDDVDAAQILVQSDAFQENFIDKQGPGKGIEKINLEITEVVHYPLPGVGKPPARTAPLSFVVRYYGPVKDAAQFVDFYTKNHPPILSKFPGIRNVLCYLPLNWRSSAAINDDRLIIGNEVVFDDLTALKYALKTDILTEAQEDGSHFQKFGYSTHHAMHRERVFKR
jgi:uncharacterized protein (TIGR02118 family)